VWELDSRFMEALVGEVGDDTVDEDERVESLEKVRWPDARLAISAVSDEDCSVVDWVFSGG